MSNPVSPRPEPEDLSVLVRRGHASHSDEDALQDGLTRDATLRIAHQVGLDLDRETSVRSGDEELILRAADAALFSSRAEPPASTFSSRADAPASTRSRMASPRKRGPWQLAAAIVLAVVLSSSGIGAALWVAGVTPWRMPERTIVAGTAPAKRAPHKPSHKAQTVAPAPLPPVELAPDPVVPEPESEPTVPSARARRSEGALRPDAGELFRAANAARRAGEFARAKHLYSELIHKHPSADEAQLAHVSLGKLLLSQGQAGRAEREFRRYLEAGGGPLSEEALFNRAECLLRLGRAAEEKLAWRALLSAYPGSLYAARAKQRLDAEPSSPASP